MCGPTITNKKILRAMEMKKLLLLPVLLWALGAGNVACSYRNDDNPNEYPDPRPEPEPEPDP